MVDRLPPLYALRAFEVAARSCSFTRAGEELALTQSAISRHIRTLEAQFGCRLFERHGPRLRLTDAGQRLAEQLGAGFALIEQACQPFRSASRQLRLKAPSTLTMRWLLGCIQRYTAADAVQLASVWMDVDSVDFAHEPYDCAVLLGNGQFGRQVEACKLFDEQLIPICAPGLLGDGEWDATRLAAAPLLHPSTDRRDWQRWLRGVGLLGQVDLGRGMLFDTLEQGIAAAMAGHGVSIGDLALVIEDVRAGRLALPFEHAVATGDGYYLVWPVGSAWRESIERLRVYLLEQLPA
ncbi:LysR family transcriptional regulator [Pseudomonas aegrilactucae]|uniref:LysR family transcriptional regulator n=1 Tax=Pseudomonas aegrilactucae TaxID=2854028 RepID=A0A9Q2XI57_9PSED|nr:LysR family transcriptional regulator [Pseudomonas aegrilactucae]MBV6286750.1 LysR family transcriptional regulator [Pseudomonas aegrilactucae]